jgi:uncharacterized Zn finger protein
MAYGYGGWAPYVPVAERRRKAAQEMEKLRKKGHPVSPVTISGRAIATTFWGKAWCENLESYRDYENRLPRGRTYVRNGSVVDLQIAPLAVTAMVSGSSIYKVSITIAAVPKPQWQSICRDCSGGIDSLVELLQGRLSKAVMERLCRQDRGLFPRPSEIRFKCSCPDSASMCKHIAAVLYGVGSRLDHQPELLFRLRSVNEQDLLPDLDRALPLSKTGPAAGRVLAGDDLSALFDLDFARGEGDGAPMAPEPQLVKPPAPKKAASVASRNKDVAAKKAAPNARESRKVAAATTTPGDPEAKLVATAQAKHVQAAIKPVQSGTKTSKTAPGGQKTVKSGPPARVRNAVWDPSDIYEPED